jgi:hypothetical protein
MTSFLCLIPKLLIAGGSSFLGTLELPTNPVINNYTLAGEKIPSTQVVCRDRWGTPMLPDGKAGYSLIAPIKKGLIAQSLWVPPVHGEKPLKAPVVPSTNPSVPAASPAVAVPAITTGSLPVAR